MTKSLLLLFIVITNYSMLLSQTSRDASVVLSARVQRTPATITLCWNPSPTATKHIIYRKLKSGSTWGAVIANLEGTDTTFIDANVTVGTSYEYRVLRQAPAFSGNGYINAGIEVPFTYNRGVAILVVDNTFTDSLSAELKRLADDMKGDGWQVKRIDVARDSDVKDVKAQIVSLYKPNVNNALFLIGRVPVPYSGEINVDGHTDHTGAYPADVYYAEINGTWTDAITNNISASDSRNHNIPEDGKFDQSSIPGDVEMQVGRVDFFNMPSFPESEIALMRAYLDKDHQYRHKKFSIAHRALIDDNFGFFGGEAFASGGWNNASVLVGKDNVRAGDYFPEMATEGYLWSYGCGGGWYQGAGGVGTTTDFAASDLQTVFTMLFGSYFGDWDTQNNFLRAPLAQGKTLTNVWSGRPHWQFHHMGLGENIGYDVRLSQNNNGLYSANFGSRIVHMAFLGDPTLRNDIVSPPSDLQLAINNYNVHLQWNASSDSILGYHVFRKSPADDEFEIITNDIITATQYTDECLFEQGKYEYLVRGIALQTSASGSYYNLSQGTFNEIIYDEDPDANASFDYISDGYIVTFNNTTGNAESYLWHFGDGDTSHQQHAIHIFSPGTYDVMLISSNECDVDTVIQTISIVETSTGDINEAILDIYPNPSQGSFLVSFEPYLNADIRLYTSTGILLLERKNAGGNTLLKFDGIENGIYFMTVEDGTEKITRKIIIQE